MITLPISLSVSYSFCSLNSALKKNTPVPAKLGRKPLMNNQMVQDLLRRKRCIFVATVTEMCRILTRRSSFMHIL